MTESPEAAGPSEIDLVIAAMVEIVRTGNDELVRELLPPQAESADTAVPHTPLKAPADDPPAGPSRPPARPGPGEPGTAEHR